MLPTYTNEFNNIPQNNLHNVQSQLQFELLNKLKTGNIIIDTILMSVMMTIVSGIVLQAGNILNSVRYAINPYFSKAYNFVHKHYNKRFGRKKITKTVLISYVTDNKQINELYKAVFWFLSSNTNNIDHLHEPFLKYTCDQKIEMINGVKQVNKKYDINKHIDDHKIKEIIYNEHIIKYSLSKNLITIHSDKDKKRENYNITLYVDVDEHTKEDIIDDFCQHCMNKYANSMNSTKWEQFIYVNEGDKWIHQKSNNHRKLDTVILKKGLKEDIRNDANLFVNSESWYKHRDIPYTRGYLFYGLPGTGKTSVIKGLSNELQRHIHYLMLNNIKNDLQLLELLKNINYSETILVIEDIDCMNDIVKMRTGKIKKKKKDDKEESELTLSGLLNALDGIFSNSGRILVMTTNHPEVLDAALIRPGRIDRKFLFDYCDNDQIKELYEMFFEISGSNEQIQHIQQLKYSPAHITSIFLQYRNNPEIALEHINDENNTKITSIQNNILSEFTNNCDFKHDELQSKNNIPHARTIDFQSIGTTTSYFPAEFISSLRETKNESPGYGKSKQLGINGTNGIDGSNDINGTIGIDGPSRVEDNPKGPSRVEDNPKSHAKQQYSINY
jgi:hypothetical protein